jgi:hypothetical protein
MNNFKAAISISYPDVFEDYKDVKVEQLISSLPSKKALEYICHYAAQAHLSPDDSEIQINIAVHWSARLPAEVAKKVRTIIGRSTTRTSSFNIINNLVVLALIERILENYNDHDAGDHLTDNQELVLFKAYLCCTEEWLIKQSKALPDGEIATANDFVRTTIPIQLPQVETIEFKNFTSQFIKAIYFFRFCEKNEIFSEFLKVFLNDQGLDSWKDYLQKLSSAYLRRLTPPNIPTILEVKDENKDFADWIARYCVDTNDYKCSDDFTGLRSKPVLMLEKSKYLFLNLNFFVDKFYQGIQFDFATALITNKVEYKGKPIKNFPGFKQVYGEVYSEVGLFYEVMSYLLKPQKKYVKLTGEKLKAELKEGEPDFYVRDKSKIYLFEYKDVLLNADVKHSYDYAKIVDAVFTKMVQNQGGKDKGIAQLINSIEKLGNGDFECLDDISKIKPIVYPIIVYTDLSFNIPGINLLLEQKFREEIKNKGLDKKLDIRKLVLIDIDCLIKFQDLFREKKLTLNHVLNGYHKYVQTTHVIQKASTFSQFLHSITEKKDYGAPKMLMEEALQLIIE